MVDGGRRCSPASWRRRTTCTRPTAAWCPSWHRGGTSRSSCRWCDARSRRRRGARDVDGIAVTHGPGLVGCPAGRLLGGQGDRLRAPQAAGRRQPSRGPHLRRVPRAASRPRTRSWPWLVSGGHTALYLAREPRRYERSAQTRDDAAGEAFDKVAKLLGLGFPGGPAVERTRASGDPRAIAFPRRSHERRRLDSRSAASRPRSSRTCAAPARLAAQVADVAASFQAAAVKTLVRKNGRRRSARACGASCSPAASRPTPRCAGPRPSAASGVGLHVPPRRPLHRQRGDDRGGGHDRLEAGERAPLNLNAVPDLALA